MFLSEQCDPAPIKTKICQKLLEEKAPSEGQWCHVDLTVYLAQSNKTEKMKVGCVYMNFVLWDGRDRTAVQVHVCTIIHSIRIHVFCRNNLAILVQIHNSSMAPCYYYDVRIILKQ